MEGIMDASTWSIRQKTASSRRRAMLFAAEESMHASGAHREHIEQVERVVRPRDDGSKKSGGKFARSHVQPVIHLKRT